MIYFLLDSHYRDLELENPGHLAEACKMDLINVCSRQRKKRLLAIGSSALIWRRFSDLKTQIEHMTQWLRMASPQEF